MIAVIPQSRTTAYQVAQGLAQFDRQYGVVIVSGTNRVDTGIYRVEWLIHKAIKRWTSVGLNSQGLRMFNNIVGGGSSMQDENEKWSDQLKGWASVLPITIQMLIPDSAMV